ncbi:MAG: trypsin-like serine protease [bacterium]|nr:trypsin-like serine protease [bacterium]
MRTLTGILCSFAILLPVSVPSAAQSDIDASRRNAIVRAIEQAAPAVVSVNVVEIRARREYADFWDLFEMRRPQVRLEMQRLDSVGSGFVFDKKGHILTNSHVLEGADKVASVTLADGRQIEVEFVGADERTDLAVLRAKIADLPPLVVGDSSDLMIGEWVIAIGNPFGTLIGDAQPTASVGVVSANHRRLSRDIGGGERLYQDMIQTDAAINPGNSGGPLVNARGEVVGINTMIFSRSGGSVGLGFAIPIARARRVAGELIKYGRRRDPWAGFKVEDVHTLRRNLKQQLGVQGDSGCLVVNILRTSPAYKAGLRPGDVVASINNTPVRMSSDIDFVMWDLFVGDSIELGIDRNGRSEVIRFYVEELAQ